MNFSNEYSTQLPTQAPTPASSFAATRPTKNKSTLAASSRDEMNLAEFPLAVLSTRVDSKVKTLEFSDTHRSPSGELVERKWIITGADKFGLPTSTDDDVVLGLIRLTMDRGFRERKVYFTRYELLKTLRWSTEGRSYARLIRSLDRLSGVRIRSSNSFYDNSSKSYQTCNFGIIDAYEINDSRAIGEAAHSDCKSKTEKLASAGEQNLSFFIWSEALFDSFQAGYIKKLDLDLYFSLRSAVSRRLYRYLDKHFYYKSSLERPLLAFAFEKLGLSRSYKYVSSVKQQLEPALEELISIGFLSSYEFCGRGCESTIRLNGASAAKMAPVAKPGHTPGGFSATTSQIVPAAGQEPKAQEHQQALAQLVARGMAALVARGMAAPQAQKLVSALSAQQEAKFAQLLRYYDHLVQTKDFKVSKNKIGFLYRAVERIEEFQIPLEFQAISEGTSSSASSASSRGLRPELKVFRAQTAPKTPRSEQTPEKLQDIAQRLEALRPIIGEERYQELLTACKL